MQPEEHREALLKLWRENMPDEEIARVAPERFRWLYDQNPAGPAQTWVGVLAPGDEVIGCGSLVPRRMLVEGVEINAGILADFTVAKKHRTAGAAIAIQRAVAKGGAPAGFAFQYCYPNEAALPIFRRVRYQPIGETRSWVKPLRTEYKLRDYIKVKPLVKPIGKVVDAALRANDWRTFLTRPRLFRARITDSADHRFDKLWANTQPRYITGERSSAYLNWRYAGFTSANYQFFCLHRRSFRIGRRVEDEELLGYVIYYVKENKVFVADIFCDFETNLGLLLFGFSDRMRDESYYSISVGYFGHPFLGEALEAQHFIKRPNTRVLLAFLDKSAPEKLKQTVLDSQNWFMVDGELDI
jgi:hypothetical protein